MNSDSSSVRIWLIIGTVLILAVSMLNLMSNTATAADVAVVLSGDREVPPVKSAGSATGTIVVGDDKTVRGSVTSTGIDGTAAHIHEAAPGRNGAVVIPLTKSGNTYTVPAGASLTAEQYASFQAGKLYVNIHTAANPEGEIRGQLEP